MCTDRIHFFCTHFLLPLQNVVILTSILNIGKYMLANENIHISQVNEHETFTMFRCSSCHVSLMGGVIFILL